MTRYYSRAVLSSLHRQRAAFEWSKLARNESVTLERALAAFDVFVFHDRNVDGQQVRVPCGDAREYLMCAQVEQELDDIAARLLETRKSWQETPTRQKAVLVASYLRDQGLVGMKPDRIYEDLRHNFIGLALKQEEHSSLPLISTAIYCAVAHRLGLNARPCGIPGHVLSMVYPSPGMDLDGRPLTDDAHGCPMFLDPFTSGVELPFDELCRVLHRQGVNPGNYAGHLRPTEDIDTVLRAGRNLVNSVQEFWDTHQLNGRPLPDPPTAFYGAIWMFMLLDGRHSLQHLAMRQRRQYLPHLITRFETDFPMDAFMLQEYLTPLFDNTEEEMSLRDTLRGVIAEDTMPRDVKNRSQLAPGQVKYRVGQVLRHRRYNYAGVIFGWDVECNATTDWIVRMGVDRLPRGRQQSFYHVLYAIQLPSIAFTIFANLVRADDHSARYVAEENIKIEEGDVPFGLLTTAGRYFKRWDQTSRTFVSNVRDEYPDD